MKAVAIPDHVEVHPLEMCPCCQASLEEVLANRVEKRQVFDLPEMKLEVTEHRAEIKRCPECGSESRAEFPENVTQPTQYGPGVRALVVYLYQYQMLPLERVGETFRDVSGQSLAEGTILDAGEAIAVQVARVNEAVKQHLTEQEAVVHFDETRTHINGKLHWLHSASTARFTYCACHAKRGHEASDAIGILPKLRGLAMHDGWKSYFRYMAIQHGLCNAHHLRELIFLTERYPQKWETEMLELLLEIKKSIDEVRNKHSGFAEQQLAKYNRRNDELVEKGYRANPIPDVRTKAPKKRGRRPKNPALNLLERLRDHKEATLAFMNDFRVPFDNNQTERDLRMMKVKMKVSGGFRSDQEARIFCEIRAYLSTARKNGQRMLDVLQRALASQPNCPDFIAILG